MRLFVCMRVVVKYDLNAALGLKAAAAAASCDELNELYCDVSPAVCHSCDVLLALIDC